MIPNISVIVPAYNSERSIEKCLVSLIKQTLNEIEIVVVDDGSTDDTESICKAIQEIDTRIKIIRQENSGVSAARNRGLMNSTGKYVMFVDSDDSVDSNYCLYMFQIMEQEKCDLVICGYVETDRDSSCIKLPMLEYNALKSFEDIFYTTVLNGMMNIPWNKIFVRGKIHNLFNINRSVGEDLEFNLNYLKDSGKIVILNQPLYYYNTASEGSLTKMKYLVYEAKVACCELIERFVKEKQIVFRGVESRYYATFLSSLKKAYLEDCGYINFKTDFSYLRDNYYLTIAKEKKSNSVLHFISRYCILLNKCFPLYFLFSLKYR